MKAHTLLVGFAVLAGSSICWAQASSQPQASGGQSLTRAQVIAELEDARRKGLIPEGDVYPLEMPATGPGKTRVEVIQELQEAREQGVLDFHEGEYPVVRNTGPGKSRDEVLLELQKARQQGLPQTMDP
ncbi:DUF4148 domain-containing protein [Pseudomonas sp. CJQ_7]|uniref:DUF4148 domain-containing protein n=1 Tax=Pseudomonas sp. CJQ_7 TaxID=3367166 RepID=UPI003709D7E2